LVEPDPTLPSCSLNPDLRLCKPYSVPVYTVQPGESIFNITGTGKIRWPNGSTPNLQLLRQDGILDAEFVHGDIFLCNGDPTFGCGLRLSGPGTLTLTNGGRRILDILGLFDVRNGTLALAGNIESTQYNNNFNVDGALDISQIHGGSMEIGALVDTYQVGRVHLGSKALIVHAGSAGPPLEGQDPGPAIFHGVISDGGIGGGTGGGIQVFGTFGLAGLNTYTGVTTIAGANAPSTLFLSGQGSIAASRYIDNQGIFDISAISGPPDDPFDNVPAVVVTDATVNNIGGAGTIHLGSKTLNIANADGEISGTIDSPCAGTEFRCGSLIKRGPGTLRLSGNSTYNAWTYVDAGALELTGSIASSVDVASGATLRGTGTVAGLQLFNEGTVAPGLSIGTLTLAGDYNQRPSGVLQIEIAPDGSSNDLLVSTGGRAFLEGRHEVTVTGSGALTPAAGGRSYTIIQTAGGVFGTFNNVLDPIGAYAFQTLYVGNRVDLGITYIGFAAAVAPPVVAPPGSGTPSTPSGTPNQISTAIRLDQVPITRVPTPAQPVAGFSSGNADFDRVLTVLSNQSGNGLLRAFNSIIAEPYADFLTVLLGQNEAFSDMVLDRAQACTVRGRGAMRPDDRIDPARSLQGACPTDDSPNAWLDLNGTDGRINGGNGLSGYDYRYSGAVLGLDTRVSPSAVIGGALGFMKPRLDNYVLGDATIKGDSYFASVYASGTTGPWEISAIAAYTQGDFDAERRIVFGGLDRTARARFDGHGWMASTRLAYRIEGTGFDILPEIGLGYSRISQRDVIESGAGSLDLHVDDVDADALVASIGLRFGGEAQWGATAWQPQGVIRYDHDLSADSDGAHDIRADFLNVPAPGSIDIVGRNRGDHGLYAGFGTAVQLSAYTSAYIGAGYRLNENGREYNADLGVRTSW